MKTIYRNIVLSSEISIITYINFILLGIVELFNSEENNLNCGEKFCFCSRKKNYICALPIPESIHSSTLFSLFSVSPPYFPPSLHTPYFYHRLSSLPSLSPLLILTPSHPSQPLSHLSSHSLSHLDFSPGATVCVHPVAAATRGGHMSG